MPEPMQVTVHDGVVAPAMVSEIFGAIHQPVYRF